MGPLTSPAELTSLVARRDRAAVEHARRTRRCVELRHRDHRLVEPAETLRELARLDQRPTPNRRRKGHEVCLTTPRPVICGARQQLRSRGCRMNRVSSGFWGTFAGEL